MASLGTRASLRQRYKNGEDEHKPAHPRQIIVVSCQSHEKTPTLGGSGAGALVRVSAMMSLNRKVPFTVEC